MQVGMQMLASCICLLRQLEHKKSKATWKRLAFLVTGHSISPDGEGDDLILLKAQLCQVCPSIGHAACLQDGRRPSPQSTSPSEDVEGSELHIHKTFCTLQVGQSRALAKPDWAAATTSADPYLHSQDVHPQIQPHGMD